MTARVEKLELAHVRVSARTTWTLIRLTADGETGLGECSDAGTEPEIEQALAAAARGIIGCDIENPPPPSDGGLASTTVAGALELACLDLLGKRHRQPIWKLLGGTEPGPIELYANINRAADPRTPDSFAETASRAVKEGFRAVKCAPFDRPDDEGLAIVEAIRNAVGPGVKVMVDLHHRVPLEQLIGMLPALERLGVAWLEDAVTLDQPDQLRRLSQRTRIPMAGGEMCSDPAQLGPSLGPAGLNVVLPDVKHAGGLRAARRLAEVAAAGGAQISPHNPTSPIGTAASLHLAALVPNVVSLEFAFGEAEWRAGSVEPPEQPHNGRLTAPNLPGLGLTTNPDRIQFRTKGGEI